MRMRRASELLNGCGLLLAGGLLLASMPRPARALPAMQAQWQLAYPASDSDAAGCQLCHRGILGGEPWNAYG